MEGTDKGGGKKCDIVPALEGIKRNNRRSLTFGSKSETQQCDNNWLAQHICDMEMTSTLHVNSQKTTDIWPRNIQCDNNYETVCDDTARQQET